MGTRSATSEIVVKFQSTIENEMTDGHTAAIDVGEVVQSGTLENGVSANEANRAWENLQLSISSGGTVDIDLYDFAGQDIGAGDGADALGQPLAVEEIVCLVIKQESGDGRLEIMPTSPANSVTWIPTAYATVANGGALRAGAFVMLFNGTEAAYDVQDGVSHLLRLGANGGDVVAKVQVLGRHDDNESSSSSSTSSTGSSESSSSSSSSSSSTSSLSTLSSSSTSTASTLSSSSTSTLSVTSISTESSSSTTT
jgi:hypothetical protein